MIERGDELVGDGEAHLLGLLGHDGLGHEVGDDLLVEAEGAGLLGGDDGAELASEPLQLVGIGIANLIDRDGSAADLAPPSEAGVARKMSPMPQMAKLTMRAPKKIGGDDFADQRLPSLAHVPKHREPVSQKLVKPADKRSGALRKGQVWLKEGSSLC